MKRPKLLFLSSTAVPQQVKLCYALQEYFDAEFWFYESPDRTRGEWWRIPLGDRCKVLENVLFFTSGPWASKYLVRGLDRQLAEFAPDILMLGGFSIPSNMLAYSWARRRGKKTIIFTERSRNRQGILRKRGLVWAILRWFYRDVDMVITSADDAVEQLRDEFRFGKKVVAGRYAADLDAFFDHPLREAKPAYTYLFANRLTPLYNPLGALEIFADVAARHPGSRLLMNASGELREECTVKSKQLGIFTSVEFLTDIPSWNDLPAVYARSDILILPANFSNGNFTILEGMASGMGIVVSDRVLGIGKMISDGVNGFNCEPSVAAFVERIDHYVSEPQLLKEHARINRRMVKPLSVRGTAAFLATLIEGHLKEEGSKQ